jgi:UDP-N-acetyl-D-mannosaminuronic acid dehydrogenase
VSKASIFKHDVCIVGGAGHVGVPLALVLADSGFHTLILDTNKAAMEMLASGHLPFFEEEGEPLLRKALRAGTLGFTQNPADLRGVPAVVVTIGTPIDEFHNPNFTLLTRCIDNLLPHLTRNQTLILRSTVAPGATDFLERHLRRRGSKVGLAFCPERVVQGKGVAEIQSIPQFAGATSPRALKAARDLFTRVSPLVIEMTPLEAEFAKLICNTFRYLIFAATNQIYMMCAQAGVDYLQLLEKIKRGYPRMTYIPGPGFAAGPCLMKDTMQLFAFDRHNFLLGQIAMTINEGLPNFLVDQLRRRMDLRKKKVGILGMAFKAESDDIRDSLSYKLGKILRFEGAEVIYSDEYVKDPTFVSKEELCRRAEVIIVGVPHRAYRALRIRRGMEVVDLWKILPARSSKPDTARFARRQPGSGTRARPRPAPRTSMIPSHSRSANLRAEIRPEPAHVGKLNCRP